MKNLTQHQDAVLSVISKMGATQIQTADVVKALPQYTPQCAALIIGSLHAKGELAVCTTATMTDQLAQLQKNSEELAELRDKVVTVDEQSVFQFLLEDAERAHALFVQLQQVAAVPSLDIEDREQELQEEYRAALSLEVNETDDPVILPEFNEAYFDSLSAEDKALLGSIEKVHDFIAEGDLLEELQQSNAQKVIGPYAECILTGKPLEFYDEETNTLNLEAVRFFGDRETHVTGCTDESYFSFDNEVMEMILESTVNDYLDSKERNKSPLQTSLEILGLSMEQVTDPFAIKKAYRKLAMQNHPDRGGDAELMTKINDAYQLLNAQF